MVPANAERRFIRSDGALPLPLAGEGWGGGASAKRAGRVDRFPPPDARRTMLRIARARRPPPRAGEVKKFRGRTQSTIFKQPKISRGAIAPGLCFNLPPRKKRAWGMPGARCTHGPRAKKSTGVGPQVHRDHPAFPHADGFNGFLRALPGDRACLATVALRSCSRELDASVGASGPHDFAVRESLPQKTFPAVLVPFRRSFPAKADQRRPSRAAAASTASRPTSVTIAKRPSEWDGMAGI